jgi:hypothetical protein
MNRILTAALLALLITGIANGQQKEKSKSNQDVIIKKNGKSDVKMTIVIDGENITINGKPITEAKGTRRSDDSAGQGYAQGEDHHRSPYCG